MVLNWKQKILLSILNEAREITRLKLFKISFLLSKEANFYNFVPYKFGPYSFEMERDLNLLLKNNLIKYNQNNLVVLQNPWIEHVNIPKKILNFINFSEKELLNYVDKNFRYYTMNSKFTKSDDKHFHNTTKIAIYTIGYEGITIDEFINILIKSGIKTLIDVRNKPFSYKYGFNITWLKKYLPEFDIEYISIPELGIREELRKKYPKNKLWKIYKNNISKKHDILNKVVQIINHSPSMLMCFEKKPMDCHRFQLAKILRKKTGLEIINL